MKKKMKTWRVIATVRRAVDIEAPDAETAEKIALNNIMLVTPDDVVNVRVGWLDDARVSHLTACEGQHCGHFECCDGEGMYCSQCVSDAPLPEEPT